MALPKSVHRMQPVRLTRNCATLLKSGSAPLHLSIPRLKQAHVLRYTKLSTPPALPLSLIHCFNAIFTPSLPPSLTHCFNATLTCTRPPSIPHSLPPAQKFQRLLKTGLDEAFENAMPVLPPKVIQVFVKATGWLL